MRYSNVSYYIIIYNSSKAVTSGCFFSWKKVKRPLLSPAKTASLGFLSLWRSTQPWDPSDPMTRWSEVSEGPKTSKVSNSVTGYSQYLESNHKFQTCDLGKSASHCKSNDSLKVFEIPNGIHSEILFFQSVLWEAWKPTKPSHQDSDHHAIQNKSMLRTGKPTITLMSKKWQTFDDFCATTKAPIAPFDMNPQDWIGPSQ